jgi:LytS/YehU family sensor histidine kinase
MPRIAAASVLLAVLHNVFLFVVEVGIYRDTHESYAQTFIFAVFRWTLIFLVWLTLYFGNAVLEQRRNDEVHRLKLERALRDAELGALRSQLNPHFLFNSLNGIRALVGDDPARAQDAITQISRILRYTLRSRAEEMVSLERELSIVDDYLALEALRLDTRLSVARHIDDGALTLPIPTMLVQTLVENAIKHGISELPEGGVLELSARVHDDELAITVANPRPTARRKRLDGDDAGTGVGLANARERLRLLFGTNATLDLDLSIPTRATARVSIRVAVAE